MRDLKFKVITEKIIGASMKVHVPGDDLSTCIGDRITEIRATVFKGVEARLL